MTQEVQEEKKEKPKPVMIIIPQCCRESWPNCPHVPKKQRIAKRNVGL